MDILNWQKVEELKDENLHLKNRLYEAESAVRNAEDSLNKLLELRDTAPEDCTPGTYCQACEFVKVFAYRRYFTDYTLTGYYCGKGKSCKNFIQKGET